MYQQTFHHVFSNILFASVNPSRNKCTQSLRRAEGNKNNLHDDTFFGDMRNIQKSRLKYKKYTKVKKHRRKACNTINKVVYIAFCVTLHESVLLTNFYYTAFMAAAATTKKTLFFKTRFLFQNKNINLKIAVVQFVIPLSQAMIRM